MFIFLRRRFEILICDKVYPSYDYYSTLESKLSNSDLSNERDWISSISGKKFELSCNFASRIANPERDEPTSDIYLFGLFQYRSLCRE